METIGDRVKAVRKKASLTQDEFAESLGATFNQISSIEINRSAPDEIINAICKHYKIDKEWLLTGAGDKPKGVIIRMPKQSIEQSWKEEAYNRIKAENERLWALVEKLTGASVAKTGTGNFNAASIKAGTRAKQVYLPEPIVPMEARA